MDNKIIAVAAVVILLVAGVGAYMFLGNDGNDDSSTAHAIKYDGVVPSEDNVLNGTYSIQRNLVLVTKGEPTGNVACFLNWITSAEGQEILGKEFVKLDESKFTSFTAPSQDGKTTIACGGSTSINETMTKLAQAYMAKYPYMNITVSGGGSGVGEKSTDSGIFDIGMLSRDMGSAYEGNLVPVNIGRDGVAIIANITGVENLSAEQVAKIFSGEITNWNQVGGPDKAIGVITREDGSGTRECFENAMKVADSSWTLIDKCITQNSTGGVIGLVQTTEGTIGYISIGQLGALSGKVVSGPHALEYNGIEASESNVLNGTYSIQRNLVLVTKGEPTGNVACFLNWITSAEGQEILGKEFVKLDESKFTSFTAPSQDGKTTIACGGSTSINETMTKLAQAYMAKYPYMNITVSGGGSGVGEKSTDSGIFDIGMLSRDMGSAYEGNLVPVNIGRDGVAIIANITGVENLSAEQVAKIFSGEITNWNQVGGPDKAIGVITREDGSGTRECFENAMKATDSSWTLKDNCNTQNSTGGVIGLVQSAEGTIGYISIGQLETL